MVNVRKQWAGPGSSGRCIIRLVFRRSRVRSSVQSFIEIHESTTANQSYWATTWQNQQSDCAPSEDPDQPGHPPSLISLRCALTKLRTQAVFMLIAKTLIRLGGCTHIFLVLSCHGSVNKYLKFKWARSCKNVSYAICEQQRCRSACAFAQSDQHLCCSLPR